MRNDLRFTRGHGQRRPPPHHEGRIAFDRHFPVAEGSTGSRTSETCGKTIRVITTFIRRRLDICEAFGFAPPKGCGKDYVSGKVTEDWGLGRPRKAAVVADL